MPVDEFLRRTPESRTPYVLALLGAIGIAVLLWRALRAAGGGVELLVAAAAIAIAGAVWRYRRQRRY